MMKSLLKKMPGFKLARDLLLPRSAGAWLYAKDNLSWLNSAERRADLPATYRVFGLYCSTVRHLWDGPVLGAERLLHALMPLSQRLGEPRSVPVHIDGKDIWLNLDDPRFLRVPTELTSPESDVMVLSELLKPGDWFIDVGANHGSFSLFASQLVGSTGHITAIEAQPRLAELICKSLANTATDHKVHAVACGAELGSIDLLIPRSTSGTAGIYKEHSGQDDYKQLTVPLARLDDLIQAREHSGSVVMKLDVEGSELAVLEGAVDFLEEYHPVIFMEVNPSALEAAGGSLAALLTLLESRGYSQYREALSESDARFPLGGLKGLSHRNVVID